MRLEILFDGHRPFQKLLMRAMRSFLGYVPGPVATLSYRRELFGKAFSHCLEEAMRQARCWQRGELELFAAFVSRLNACRH